MLLLLTTAACCAPVRASDIPSSTDPATEPSASTTGQPGNEQLMRLGAGDLISVRVYGQPDMDGDLYVSDEGTITVPLLGAVPVANLSSVDAARKVETALRRQQILVQPHVSIQVVQSHSQLVSILGEIKSPGRYPISPGTNVIEMLAQAGGETQDGASFVYVLRPAPGGTKRYRISLAGLGDPHDPLTTDALEAGDSIYVPKAEEIYVYGEVRAPGQYRYEPGMTVMEAIARAGGVTDRGSSRRMALKRSGPDGQAIVVAARPDDPVQPDDNIRVKESIF